jgi:GNAT superfamily N-acetyltransferase
VSETTVVTRTEVVDLLGEDLAEIHDLRLRASDFFAETGDPPPTPESFQADLDDLPEGYTRADETIYRAYRSGRLVGYAEVLRRFAHEDQWIIGIALVDPATRSDGIGLAIVDAIADDARAAGMTSLAVGVIVSRERSMAFWTREGFTTEVRRRPITIGDVESEVARLERSL